MADQTQLAQVPNQAQRIDRPEGGFIATIKFAEGLPASPFPAPTKTQTTWPAGPPNEAA